MIYVCFFHDPFVSHSQLTFQPSPRLQKEHKTKGIYMLTYPNQNAVHALRSHEIIQCERISFPSSLRDKNIKKGVVQTPTLFSVVLVGCLNHDPFTVDTLKVWSPFEGTREVFLYIVLLLCPDLFEYLKTSEVVEVTTSSHNLAKLRSYDALL